MGLSKQETKKIYMYVSYERQKRRLIAMLLYVN